MVRALSVFYLHRPDPEDARRLPAVEYGLTDAFRDFCRETFDTGAALDYPPLKLVVANTADGLSRALFTSAGPRGVLTEQGRACTSSSSTTTSSATSSAGRTFGAGSSSSSPRCPRSC